ncbi:MAG: glycosyltransferase [Candidatus Latescibacteria bacterium]|nr:glycosyltransferase [Candidatus Latescibacterota bacterium]
MQRNRSRPEDPRPRTLLHLAEYSPHTPGAFVRCLEHLAPAVRSAGLEPRLALPVSDAPRDWHGRLVEAGWKVHLLGRPWGLHPSFVRSLGSLLRRCRPSITHLHFHAATLLPLSTLHRGRSGRRFLHWHNPPRVGRFRLRLFDSLCCPEHLTAGEWLADELKRAAPAAARRVTAIPNGIELPPRAHGIRGSDLLTVSALRSQKDPDTLLEAVALLERSGWSGRLVWVGSGPEEERVAAVAERLNLRCVVFAGDVSDPAPLYDRCAVFVLSSRYEGLPYAVLEAMAHARPVVATDLPGIRESLGEEAGRLCVPPRDPRALAAVLGDLLTDPARATEIGGRLRRRAEERYSVARWVASVLASYERGSEPAIR